MEQAATPFNLAESILWECIMPAGIIGNPDFFLQFARRQTQGKNGFELRDPLSTKKYFLDLIFPFDEIWFGVQFHR